MDDILISGNNLIGNNSPHRESKEVKCPRCKHTGYTNVKEDSNNKAPCGILSCLFSPCGCGQKYKHYCRNCHYDVTKIEGRKKCCCIIM